MISQTKIEYYGVRDWNLLKYAIAENKLEKKIRNTFVNLQNWAQKLSSGELSSQRREKLHFLCRINRRRNQKWTAARTEKAVFFHAIRWNLFQLEVARFFDKDGTEDLFQVGALHWKIEHLWKFSQARGWVWKELGTLRESMNHFIHHMQSQQIVFDTTASYGFVRERSQMFTRSPSKKWEVLHLGRNDVYWHPGSRCVFKQMNPRLEYEESLVESLSHFYGDAIPASVRVFCKDQVTARARPYFRLESLYSMKMRGMLQAGLAKLSAEGEVAAIFAAEMQFLDLSEGNVHFAKCKEKDQLLMVLLDSELSLAESNNSLYVVDADDKRSIFPFRSCLLSLLWAKKPLSRECLDWLYRLPAGDGPLWDWVNRTKETFLASASPDLQRAVLEKLARLLEKYSFSNYFAHRGDWSFAKIRWCFVRDLAKMEESEQKEFWSFIQEKFPQWGEKVQVSNFETLAYLAKKHEVSLALLQQANPLYSISEALPEGGWISIPMDLTSSSPLAKKRRRRLGKQLFPRMTLWQQKALRERQTRRAAYLHHYRTLQSEKNVSRKNLLKYVQCPSMPLPTLVRREWVQTITRLGAEDTFSLNYLQHLLIGLTKPSYYNLCLAMYPLLGDLIRIYQAVYPVGGIDLIGSFTYSLEETLASAKKYDCQEVRDLATQVADQILRPENRVYFLP